MLQQRLRHQQKINIEPCVLNVVELEIRPLQSRGLISPDYIPLSFPTLPFWKFYATLQSEKLPRG